MTPGYNEEELNDFSTSAAEEIPVAGPRQFNKKEKRIFIFGSFFSILIILLSFWQLGRQIALPAEREMAKRRALSGNFSLNSLAGVGENTEILKSLDSDNDGLSDYEESYVYSTSPYLEDSDSDGARDKDELAQGEDPNCPKGQVCYDVATTNSNTPVPAQSGLSDLVGSATSGAPTMPTTAQELRDYLLLGGFDKDKLSQISDEQLMAMYQSLGGQNFASGAAGADTSANGQPTPTELRELLLKSGFTAEALKKFSDDQILSVYQQVSGSAATVSGANTNANSSATADSSQQQQMLATIEKMTGEQLRALLAKNGFDPAVLAKYDDAGLKKLLIDSLNQK